MSWVDVLIILQLVLLEGLLSFDNALALSALVTKRLKDPHQQKKALTYGIWGAYVFRVGVIFIGTWLMENPWAKVIAGAYLVWLAVSELFFGNDNDEAQEVAGFSFKWLTPFWATIVSVELMDIMFSVDSIGVALVLSNKKWVLITGALLGILMMRVAAVVFIKLIDKFPILTKTAFVLVGIAGVNILLQTKDLPLPFSPRTFTLDCAMNEHALPVVLFGIFFGSIILNWFVPSLGKQHE